MSPQGGVGAGHLDLPQPPDVHIFTSSGIQPPRRGWPEGWRAVWCVGTEGSPACRRGPSSSPTNHRNSLALFSHTPEACDPTMLPFLPRRWGEKTLTWYNRRVYSWLQFCDLLGSCAWCVEAILRFFLQAPLIRKLYIEKKCYTTKKSLCRPSIDGKLPWLKELVSWGEFGVLVLNCIQLTSLEFDCVYEIIWCQKHCSRWAFLATVDSTKQHDQKILLTRLSASPRRVPNDRFRDISASQKFRKKRKHPERRS